MEVIMEFIKYLVFVLALSVSADGAKAPAGAPADSATPAGGAGAPESSAPAAAIRPPDVSIPPVNMMRQRLFVFGDSVLDIDNEVYLYGELPSLYLPNGISLYNPSGRHSDGLMIPDFIALFANLSSSPRSILKNDADLLDFSNGANFACPGATVIESSDPNVMDLKKQIANFKKLAALYVQQYGEANATTLMNGSVFLFSVGGVDYVRLLMGGNSTTPPADQVNLVIGNLTSALTDIFNAGGRRFAFMNMGPLGCTPGVKQMKKIGAGACDEPLNDVCKKHNEALPKALEALKAKSSGLEYIVYDYYKELLARIQDPAGHGFNKDMGDIACCGSGPNHAGACGMGKYELCKNPHLSVFWDGGHTSQMTNYELADQMFVGEPDLVAPFNMQKLFQLP